MRNNGPKEQTLSPSTIQALFQKGFDLHRQGNLPDAETNYREVLKHNPDHFDALHLLGVIAAQTNHIGEGIALMERATAINPSIAALHNNLGNALRDAGLFEKALKSYNKAIARNRTARKPFSAKRKSYAHSDAMRPRRKAMNKP